MKLLKDEIEEKQWKVNLMVDNSKNIKLYLLGMEASDEETSLLDIWKVKWH